MARRLLGLVLALALAGAAVPCLAFTPKTRLEIVERSKTLMPPGLRRQLQRHERALLLACLEPLKHGEGSGLHALGPEGGGADQALARAVEDAVALIDSRASFAEVATAFGLVAHLATDLAYPLNVSDADPVEETYYHEFSEFVDSRLDRIPLVWEGWYDPSLARRDVVGFARRAADRSRRDYELIGRAYHPEGRPSLPQDFDDRSTAFAAASLSFSRAVANTSRAWMYIWTRAHGDRTGTPYLEPGTDPFAAPASPDGSSAP
jgi:hypothetical protein